MNADQTVILIWDPVEKMQHFIRRASFESDGDDFGFLIPSPTQPELAESGDDAFAIFARATEPLIITRTAAEEPSSSGCGCGLKAEAKSVTATAVADTVTILDQKTVAGFHATVLEATSTTVLVDWLKQNNYAFSPEVEAWARPYVDQGWKITALRVAKDTKDAQRVAAGSLRLSFKTDKPLFPYREPASEASASTLGVHRRLLRIYFVSDQRYNGAFNSAFADVPNPPRTLWSGHTAWAGELAPSQRDSIVQALQIPAESTPNTWWLTEFEDPWPYQLAPSDLYFEPSPDQQAIRREPIIRYVDNGTTSNVHLGVALLAPLLALLARRSASIR